MGSRGKREKPRLLASLKALRGADVILTDCGVRKGPLLETSTRHYTEWLEDGGSRAKGERAH